MRIALSGKMKSGKTTLARELDYQNVVSFADPIRNALAELGIRKSEYPDLYRRGAQYLGTDLCRTFDPDWWVKWMNARMMYDRQNVRSTIIDDVRFPNEYDWCKASGFMLVRLDISREMQYTRGAEEGTFNHPSETGLDHIGKEEWDLWLPEQTSVQERVSAILSCLPKELPHPSGF